MWIKNYFQCVFQQRPTYSLYATKCYRSLFYAHSFVRMSLAKELLVAHSWAARWTLAGSSHLHTRGCSSAALPCAKAWWPPQEVMGMLCTHSSEGNFLFRSWCPSNYSCKDHHSAVPDPGCLHPSVGVQHTLISRQ